MEDAVAAQVKEKEEDQISGDPFAVNAERELQNVETRIEEMEQALARLNQALFEANEAMEWSRVQKLNVEYRTMQSDLDKLMARWEHLAEAQV